MRILVLALCVFIVVDASAVREALEKKILKELLLRELRDEVNTDTGDQQVPEVDTGNQEQEQQQPEQQQVQEPEEEQEEETEGDDDDEVEQSLKDAIYAQEAKYMQYFKEQNYAALADLYTDDASYYAPGEAAVHGKDQIKENVWVPGSGDGGPNSDILTFESTNVIKASDNSAIGHGEWDVSHNEDVCDKSGRIADGHYLTVYKKVDGEWLIEVDIINVVNLYPEEASPKQKAPKEPPAENSEQTSPKKKAPEEPPAENSENEVTERKRLVAALKKLLKKEEKTTTPGVLHRRGLRS